MNALIRDDNGTVIITCPKCFYQKYGDLIPLKCTICNTVFDNTNEEVMRYTSIRACDRGINYQTDYQGLLKNVKASFQQECRSSDIIKWAKLFQEISGEEVDHYSKGRS